MTRWVIAVIGLCVLTGCPPKKKAPPEAEAAPAEIPLYTEQDVVDDRIKRFETASLIDLRKTDAAELALEAPDDLVRLRVYGQAPITVTVAPGGPAGTTVRIEEFTAEGLAITGSVTQMTFAEPGGEVQTSTAPDVAEHLFEISVTPPGPMKVAVRRPK